MKKKLFLYCHKEGNVVWSNARSDDYNSRTDWIELELDVEIPAELFEKPKLKHSISVVGAKRKEYNTITKSSSTLGLAELRSGLPEESSPSGPLVEDR